MICKYDLKKSIKISIIFEILMILVLILGLILYNSLIYKQDNIYTYLEDLPKFILRGLGIKEGKSYDFFYYYALLTNVVLIISALFSNFLGFSLIFRDKKDDAIGFYLKKPIKRESIVKQKLLAGFIILFVSCFIYHLISSFLILILSNTAYNFRLLLYMNSSILLMEIVFFLIGMIVGLFLDKKRNFIIPSILTILSCEFIHIVSQAFNLTALKYINPFSYFNVLDIALTQKYQYRFIVITTFLVLFLYNFIIGLFESINKFQKTNC